MQADFAKSRIAVLGAGKMGGILVKALIEKHQLSPERCGRSYHSQSRSTSGVSRTSKCRDPGLAAAVPALLGARAASPALSAAQRWET